MPRLIAFLVWLPLAAVIIGYPLVTGKIRAGGVGSDAILRERDPSSFWMAYGISTGLFVAASIGVGIFLRSILP